MIRTDFFPLDTLRVNYKSFAESSQGEPMRTSLLLLVGTWMSLLTSEASLATNHVRIDTMSYVAPGTQGLPIGVYLTNDFNMVAIVIPLEIRSCDGAYIAGPAFSHGMNLNGRLYNSPLSPDADQSGRWPAAVYTHRTFAAPTMSSFNYCTRNDTALSKWERSAVNPDFVSPDALMMSSVSTGNPSIGEEFELIPGNDDPGVPSYVITVDVGQVAGVFVIDSTCVPPGNHVRFVGNDESGTPYYVFPTFQPGSIGVGVGVTGNLCEVLPCLCQCHGNPSGCSGESSGILDVVTIIDMAFRGVPESQSSGCPVPSSDLNCSGATDVVDVVKSIAVEFRGADPAAEFCTPCTVPH